MIYRASLQSKFKYVFIASLAVQILYGCSSKHDVKTRDRDDIHYTSPHHQAPPSSNFPQAFDSHITYHTKIYVSSGVAAGGNGSLLLPYNNIRDALLNAIPGTHISIDSGDYSPIGSLTNLHGTRQAPIALVANGTVTINGNDTEMALHLADARYIVIDGFTIKHSFPHGISIDDGGSYDSPSEYIILRNMHFKNIGNGGNNDCLKLSGVDNFYIENSEFEGCNAGEAIDMVGCHHGVITGNYFHDMPINAINTKGGSKNILIHGNRFFDIRQRAINAGGFTGQPHFRPINAPFEGSNIQIIANIFVRTWVTPIAFVGCDTCIFANNIVIEPIQFVARILAENTSRAPGGNGLFINNIIVFNTKQLTTFVDVGTNTYPSTFTFGWNLWYAQDKDDFSGPVYDSRIPPEKNSVIQQNPNLNTDYRIQAGSPATNRGRAIPWGVAVDYDRQPYSSPPSVGAFRGP